MADTFSNGYDLTRIFAALQGRLGWHQPSFPNAPTLTDANLSATAGRWYDRGFKPVNIQNYYFAQESNLRNNTDFNQLLQDEDQAAITRLCNAVLNKPALIEHKTNYTRTANIRNVLIPNQGQFAGYRINIAPGNYAVMINSIGLFFNGVGTFNLYAFNDLLQPPIYTQSVTTIAYSQKIQQLNWLFNYTNTGAAANPNMGGVIYIGCFQDDLAAQGIQAIDEQLNMWADTKIFGAYPFQAPKIAGKLDFVRINPSVNFRSYGFNMEVSSYRDYTEMIVNNPQQFDEARWLMMAINVIENIKYTTETNSNERVTGELMAKLDIDMNASNGQNGQYPFASGLKQQLEREIQKINTNFWKKPMPTSVPIGSGDWANEAYYEGMDINNLPSRENAY